MEDLIDSIDLKVESSNRPYDTLIELSFLAKRMAFQRKLRHTLSSSSYRVTQLEPLSEELRLMHYSHQHAYKGVGKVVPDSMREYDWFECVQRAQRQNELRAKVKAALPEVIAITAAIALVLGAAYSSAYSPIGAKSTHVQPAKEKWIYK